MSKLVCYQVFGKLAILVIGYLAATVPGMSSDFYFSVGVLTGGFLMVSDKWGLK